MHELLGVAHGSLPVSGTASRSGRRRARELLAEWSWSVHPMTPAIDQFAAALDGLAAAGIGVDDGLLDRYRDAAQRLGKADVESVPTDSVQAAVSHVVAATVLLEPLLLALRRLAQEDASSRRFG